MASILALLALCGVFLLALFPDPRLLPPDALLSEKAALLFLTACFLVALVPKLQKKLLEDRDAATFAFVAAFFVIFHLAERFGPKLDEGVTASYAMRLAVVGALISIPAWWRGGGPQRYIFAGLLIVGAVGLASFNLLSRFYTVGATETLDPTILPPLLLQILGYSAVAALCRAVTASDSATKALLRAVPVFLLVLAAKFQFFPTPVPAEDAE